jgi:uncharacterized membrane protein YjjB (DUF3815 family)
MARWITLCMTILGFVFVFTARNSALLAIGLLLGGIGFFGFIFALAAERVAANARPDASMASGDVALAMRKRAQQRPLAPTASAPSAVRSPVAAPDDAASQR